MTYVERPLAPLLRFRALRGASRTAFAAGLRGRTVLGSILKSAGFSRTPQTKTGTRLVDKSPAMPMSVEAKP